MIILEKDGQRIPTDNVVFLLNARTVVEELTNHEVAHLWRKGDITLHRIHKPEGERTWEEWVFIPS
jgi:hypothetical protein